METQTHPTTQQVTSGRHKISPLVIIAAALVSFGVTVLIMSSAYVRDLALLRQVPESIWLFVCGVPTDNDMTLPLLIASGVLAALVGVGMIMFHFFWNRRHQMQRIT
jgi:hypothetical protein